MAHALLPEHEREIDQLAQMGDYGDVNDLIADALWLLRARLQTESLRAKLEVGLRQIERGETVLWTPELSSQLMEHARRRAAAGDVPDPDVWP